MWQFTEWTWDMTSPARAVALWGKLSVILPLLFPMPAVALGVGLARMRKAVVAWAVAAIAFLWVVQRTSTFVYGWVLGDGDFSFPGCVLSLLTLNHLVATAPRLIAAISSGMLLGSLTQRGPMVAAAARRWRAGLSACCILLGISWFLMAWHKGTIAYDWDEYVRTTHISVILVAGLWFAWPPLLAAIGYLGVYERFRPRAPWVMGGLTLALFTATASTSWLPIYVFGSYLGAGEDFGPSYVSLWLLAGPLVWPSSDTVATPSSAIGVDALVNTQLDTSSAPHRRR